MGGFEKAEPAHCRDCRIGSALQQQVRRRNRQYINSLRRQTVTAP
jgi:hypothetical protein